MTVLEPLDEGYYYTAGLGARAFYTYSKMDALRKVNHDKSCALLRKRRKEILEEFKDVRVEMVLGDGDVEYQIAEYAQDKADFIVLGSRSLDSIQRFKY